MRSGIEKHGLLLLTFLLLAAFPSLAQVDSTGKKYYDFNKVRVLKSHGKIVLQDTSVANAPFDICPQLSIDKLCSISSEHSAAIVRSGRLYHVINRYGECSIGFEREPLVFISHTNGIFVYKTRKSRIPCLYDMQGNEMGQISHYTFAELVENSDKKGDTYFRIYDAKDKQGLVNAKGELMMECIYDYISGIREGTCKISIHGRAGTAYLDKLKVQQWK